MQRGGAGCDRRNGPGTGVAHAHRNEYSFGYDNVPLGIRPQPERERPTFTFQVSALSRADYRVEVQTVCQTPTAVTLSSLQASRTAANLPVLGLVGIPLITVSLLGGNTVLRRKHAARERRP